MPLTFAYRRDDDKYNYRYRGGESYRDVVIRLEPIIMELERSENVIIVTHQAVVRCIFAYFNNMHQSKSPWMVSPFNPRHGSRIDYSYCNQEVPLHTLMKLTPKVREGSMHGSRETGADNVTGIRHRGRALQGRHPGSEHVEGEGEYSEA